MPEYENKGALIAPADPPTATTDPTRSQRLAVFLADLIPGAALIRVSQQEPGYVWPSPYAHAYDAFHCLMTINRTQAKTAARWVIRSRPDVNWTQAYDFDLITGVLTPAEQMHAATNGGC